MLPKFKKIRLSDVPLQKFQDATEASLNEITNKEVIDGILLTEVKLITGKTNEVEHKLGRKPLGWIITRQRRDSSVWDLQDSNIQPSKTLSLACSVDVIIDIWVF